MKTISLKLEKTFLSEIEKMMKKHNYATKTELIRESIRDKLKELKGKEERKTEKSNILSKRSDEPRPIPSYI